MVQIYGGAVASAQAIESANICGYQNIDVVNGYKFFTVTFENISDAQNFKLSDIKCTKDDGTEWLRTGAGTKACNGAISVRKISTDGIYGTEYKYYGKNASDTFGPGWYEGDRADDGSNLVTKDNDVNLAPGEGLLVYSSKSAAEFVVAGNVRLGEFTGDVANGYAFGGNNNPVQIGLSEILCTKDDGTEWLRTGAGTKACNGAISVRKISTDGIYGTEYKYYGKNASDTFGPGWYEGDRADDGSNLVTKDNDLKFEPGEGWIIYSSKSAAKLTVPAPIK